MSRAASSACATSTARSAIGALGTPHSTLEELYLLQKLMRGMGSGNVDFRLRQSDFALDGADERRAVARA